MTVSSYPSLGFYGKIPALGDFVSRRLPRSFIDPWDQWLQSSMRSSQEVLGEKWLEIFLVSPIWRFAISPGVCGPEAWAGVLMPSVDRVGRYFPLTMAQNIPAEWLATIFLPDCPWFELVEDLALSVLSETFDFESFDVAALSLQIEQYLRPVQRPQSLQSYADHGKPAFFYDLADLEQLPALFPGVSQSLLESRYATFSLWAAKNPQVSCARFLWCEGLPAIHAYADFLQVFSESEPPMASSQEGDHSAFSIEDEYPLLSVFETKASQLSFTDQTDGVWVSYGMTVVGNKRKHNEDAMLDNPHSGIWVVADGMGGHHSGDIASRLIVDGLSEIEDLESLELQIEWVSSRLNKINTDLCRFAAGVAHGCIIGSTVVVLLAKARQCSAIWAGDSRLYRFRQGRMMQVTNDHTLVDEMMDVANITRDEALQQVGANVITRAVGGHAELELDSIRFQAELGDRFLLCSDGLDKELSEDEIALLMTVGDCQTIVENLIKQALDKNGRDNITAVVVEFR